MPCHTLYNLSSRPRWHPPCLVNMVLFRSLTKLLFRQPQLFVWPDVRFHASTIVFFPQSQTHTQRILVLFGSRTTEGSIATIIPYRCPEISFRLGILFTPLFAVPADGPEAVSAHLTFSLYGATSRSRTICINPSSASYLFSPFCVYLRVTTEPILKWWWQSGLLFDMTTNLSPIFGLQVFFSKSRETATLAPSALL